MQVILESILPHNEKNPPFCESLYQRHGKQQLGNFNDVNTSILSSFNTGRVMKPSGRNSLELRSSHISPDDTIALGDRVLCHLASRRMIRKRNPQ